MRYSLFSYHTEPDAEGGFADFDAIDVAETPKPSIPYGKRIQLSVHDGSALLTLDKADVFTVDDRGLGRVALSAEGGYLSVATTGAVSLRRGPAGDAETFQWVDTFNGELLLLSIATNRYLRVDAGRILADSPGPRPDGRDGVRFLWQVKPEETSAQRPVIPQQLSFAPYHASGIYDVGETVGWTVTPGPAPPTYAYKWTIRRNNAVVLKEGTLDLSSGKDTIEIAGGPAGDALRRDRSGRGSVAGGPAASGRCAALHRRQHRTQHRPLRGRRSRRADQDRAVDAAAGRLRRVLGAQARRAGEDSDQCRC